MELTRRAPSIAVNLMLVLVSGVIAVAAVEAYLRATSPYATFGTATELEWMRASKLDLTQLVAEEPELGFTPILGGRQFSEYGTLYNDYDPLDRGGRTRLLFIGDSVTYRGEIVDAIRDLYGDADYEYWNAGVESYNTVQEVGYYRKFNAALEPDHVILTFHINDFETTPIAYFDGDDFVVYAPHVPARKIWPWLYRHSYLYRRVLGSLLARGIVHGAGIVEEVRRDLVGLSAELERAGIRFTVLVLPLLKPLDQWQEDERAARVQILEILTEAGIRHIDLLPALQEAFTRGIEVQQIQGDPWHPNAAVAALFAAYAEANGLL